ncbi:hypothetical protein BDQ17DRAFT_1246342, partial [Cyathus striatus]
IFENLITINMEVTYIWKSRWNVIKILYIFVRYSTYVDLIMYLIGKPLWCSDDVDSEHTAVECVPALSAVSCKSLCYSIICK